MKLLRYLAILIFAIVFIVGFRVQMDNKKSSITAKSIVDQAEILGLSVRREYRQGEYVVAVHIDRVGEIDLIPKSDIPLSVGFENCSLDDSSVELLFDGRSIAKFSLNNCSLTSAALERLSTLEIDECNFESCVLSTERSGKLQRLGHHLSLTRCDDDLTLAILTCVGKSQRVFLEPQSDVVVRLPFLEATEQLTVGECAVLVEESFKQSKSLSVLNFKRVKIEGTSISRCLSLASLAFVGFDNCEVSGLSDIIAGEKFPRNCLVDATGKELVARLAEVLPNYGSTRSSP